MNCGRHYSSILSSIIRSDFTSFRYYTPTLLYTLAYALVNQARVYRHFLYCIWGHDAVSLLWVAGEDFKQDVQVVPHNNVQFFTAGFYTPLNFTSGLLDYSVQNVPCCIYKRPPQVVWEHLDDNRNDGLPGHRPAFPLLYFTLTPPIKVLDIQNVIHNSGGSLKLSSKFIPSLKTSVWPSNLQLAATVGISFHHHSGDPQEVDGFI